MVLGTAIAAAIGGLWLTIPQSVPKGQESDLAFKASALPERARDTEGVGARVAGRMHVDRLPAEESTGARRTEQVSEGTDQAPQESTSLYSPALSTIGTPKRDDREEGATRQAIEPAPKAVAAQPPRVQAGTAEPAQAPAEGRVEKRKQVARASSDPRERELEAAAPAQDHNEDSQLWDCQPTPTGKVVCNPPGKKPAAVETTAPAAPKKKATTALPSSPPTPRPPQARTADLQIWDCQPKPPTGEVVCRPVGAAP